MPSLVSTYASGIQLTSNRKGGGKKKTVSSDRHNSIRFALSSIRNVQGLFA